MPDVPSVLIIGARRYQEPVIRKRCPGVRLNFATGRLDGRQRHIRESKVVIWAAFSRHADTQWAEARKPKKDIFICRGGLKRLCESIRQAAGEANGETATE